MAQRNESKQQTSWDFSLALNLATKSCVVTGATERRTVLISSSVTGATEDVGPVLLDVEPDPFAGALGLEEEGGSSLTPDDFES